MALTPANSWTAGAINQHSVLLAEDIVKPQYAETMIDAYGNDEYMKELLFWQMQGVKAVSTNSEGWNWFDELRFDGQVIVKADNGTATTNLKFTLDTTLINGSAGQRSVYVQAGDYLLDMATGNAGRVKPITIPGSGDITIEATSISGTNWVVPTAGKEYALYTHAEIEGETLLPQSRDSYTVKRTAKLQRFAEAVRATSDVLTDNLWFQTNEQGEYVGTWGAKQVIDLERRMAQQKTGAMILGQYTSATGLPMTTRGMWSAFKADANQGTYTADSMTINQIRDSIASLKANGVSGPIMYHLPYVAFKAMQANLNTPSSGTNANLNLNVQQLAQKTQRLIFESSVLSDPSGLVRLFDVNNAIIDGNGLNMRLMNISYQRIFNVGGGYTGDNTFLTAMFVAPTSRLADGEGGKVGLIETRYKALNGVNLMSSTGEIGWLAAGGANSEANERKRGIRSTMGFGFRALTQCEYLQEA
jgi:hypothetical protein